MERRLHDYFAAFRTRGEWFRLPPAAVALVEALGPARTTADLRLPTGRWREADHPALTAAAGRPD